MISLGMRERYPGPRLLLGAIGDGERNVLAGRACGRAFRGRWIWDLVWRMGTNGILGWIGGLINPASETEIRAGYGPRALALGPGGHLLRRSWGPPGVTDETRKTQQQLH